MNINVSIIKDILYNKGVDYLYHANTVATSITFLLKGGLMSRGMVEELHLVQTEQYTDSRDKHLGIYYDIFFDSVDIHAKAKNYNKYGPVTFVYSLDVLDDIANNIVKVTRDNPIRWKQTMPEYERYFTDIDSMKYEYNVGTFKQHLTICDMHEPLPFSPHLLEIILDDPGLPNGTYFNKAFESIKSIKSNMGLNVPLKIRKCSCDCNCRDYYRNMSKDDIHDKFKIE